MKFWVNYGITVAHAKVKANTAMKLNSRGIVYLSGNVCWWKSLFTTAIALQLGPLTTLVTFNDSKQIIVNRNNCFEPKS